MNWRRAASCRIVDVARFEFHQDPPPLEGMDKAERMLNLVKQGFMTIGVHEGQIRVGITHNGWKEVSRKLR